MSDFGWASAAIAGVSVVSSAVVAVVTPRYAAQRAAELARENRVQQRLAEAYLDVLRIAEREGLWWNAEAYNLWAHAVEDDDDPIPRRRPSPPELADQATVAALLAAFASSTVRARYSDWRQAVETLSDAHRAIIWNLHQDYPRSPTVEDLAPMREVAGPQEEAARERLAEAIAAELGHRETP
jgi:hypothetical protein